MKILYLPLNSPDYNQTGMYSAFKNIGTDLNIFDFNSFYTSGMSLAEINTNLLNTVVGFGPDLIHMQLQFTNVITPETIKQIKKIRPNTIITNWTGDCRETIPPEFINIGNLVDLNLISSTGQLKMYEALLKKPVKYWQIGIDTDLNFPLNKKAPFTHDIVFAASNHTKSNFPGQSVRWEAAQLLSNSFGVRFGLYGYGWSLRQSKKGVVPLRQINDIYNDSLCCLSISNFNDISHYFSDRLLLCMASGRPTIALNFPGWESYFIENKELIIVNNVKEIESKVKWLNKNKDLADEIGASGAKKVLAEHTYTSRVKQLLHMVGLK